MILAELGVDEAGIRSTVDTLQRIYVIVIALALTEALKHFVTDDEGAGFRKIKWGQAWALSSLLLLIVPFLHGMGGYLFNAYLTPGTRPANYGGYLLLDFGVFIFDGCLFLLMARGMSLRDRTFFYLVVVALLTVDTLWGLFVWWKRGIANLGWMCTNGTVIFLLGGFIFLTRKRIGWVWSAFAMLFILIRTFVDYRSSWRVYFP